MNLRIWKWVICILGLREKLNNFNKRKNMIACQGNQFEFISLVERQIRLIFGALFGVPLTIEVYTVLALDARFELGSSLISIVGFGVSMLYRQRWTFDKASSKVTCFRGLKLNAKLSLALDSDTFTYESLEQVRLISKSGQKNVKAVLKHNSASKMPLIELKVRVRELANFKLELTRKLALHGIEVEDNTPSITASKQSQLTPLSDESVQKFKRFQLSGNKIITDFPSSTWLFPLPQSIALKAFIPSFIGTGLALVILYSSHNVVIAYLLCMASLAGSFLYRKVIAADHYLCETTNNHSVIVAKDGIEVPGLYFEDRATQQIPRQNIKKIDVYWCVNSRLYNGTYQSSPTVNNIVLSLNDGRDITIFGHSINGNECVLTLNHFDYQGEVIQQADVINYWKAAIVLPIVIYTLYQCIKLLISWI